MIEENIYNRFVGSLKPLQNLAKLEELDIVDTDVNDGLEYLSDSIQTFYCSAENGFESKVKVLAEELRRYAEPDKDKDGDENFALPL